MTELVELQQQLSDAKTALREDFQRRALIDCAGVVAEALFLESNPTADCFNTLAVHEGGHFRMSQLVGSPAAAITMQLFPEGRLLGLTYPSWPLTDCQTPASDAEQVGARLRDCKTVGVHLDLDEILAQTERMVRSDWVNISRIGAHVASVCRTQSGGEWFFVIFAETLARLFWTREEWTARYGSGICA